MPPRPAPEPASPGERPARPGPRAGRAWTGPRAGSPPLAVVRHEAQLIVNGRASGSGTGAAILPRASAALAGPGARVRAQVTSDEAQLADVVRGAEGRRLVIVGGDGTVHALANVDLPVPPAALFPAGLANNIAHALGIPADWRAAAALQSAGGRPRSTRSASSRRDGPCSPSRASAQASTPRLGSTTRGQLR